MSSKARAKKLGETYLAAELLIQLALTLNIMLKLEVPLFPGGARLQARAYATFVDSVCTTT